MNTNKQPPCTLEAVYEKIIMGVAKSGETCRGYPVRLVCNRRLEDIMGRILWYPPWRRYILLADENAAWSADCLRDVASYLEHLDDEEQPDA
jgi:hypothetical protein